MNSITRKGSVAVFYKYKEEMQKKSPNGKVTSTSLGEMIDMDIATVSNWKNGKSIIKNLEVYGKVSNLTGVELDTLYNMATEVVNVEDSVPTYKIPISRIKNKKPA